MTKIKKSLLITLVILIPVTGSGVASYYYIIGKDTLIDDNVIKIEIGTIIQNGGTLNMPHDRFKAPTKDEISDQIVEIYNQEVDGVNTLSKEDFEILSKISPEQESGFDIEIAAKGDKYLGKTKQTIGYKYSTNIELADVITNTQISPEYGKKYSEIPSEDEFIKDIHAKNPLLDISLVKGVLELDNINEDIAYYIISRNDDTVDNPYIGEVKVGFTLKTQITQTVKEAVDMPGIHTTKPTLEEIKRQITVENELFATDFDIKEISNNSRSLIYGKEFIVELKAKGDNFRGESQMIVKWHWEEFQELQDVIEVKELPEKFNEVPSSEEVLKQVSKYNYEFEKEYVTYGEPEITGDHWSMTISADKKPENPYVGEVTVTFDIKKDIALVFENHKILDFDKVAEEPNVNDIMERILDIDPKLTSDNYSVVINTKRTWSPKESRATIKANPSSENYSGGTELTIKFQLDSKIDLKEDLKVTSLKTNFVNVPTEKEVIEELIKLNTGLKGDEINAKSITKTSAIIAPKTEENSYYNGEDITVYFNTQQSLEDAIKEDDRFAGYFGLGDETEGDREEGKRAADILVESKVGPDQFKLLKKEQKETLEGGIVTYSVEDIDSNYKGSVSIEWKYKRKMQNALEMIEAFSGGTIGYRRSGAAAWNYATEVLNNSPLKGRWTIAWDHDKTKSKGKPLKISPLHSEDKDGLIGFGLINWNEQEELNSQFPGDKAFAGYFGNGSEDEKSKQLAYEGVDKYVSETIGADQFVYLDPSNTAIGKRKYVAKNTPETKFKNTTTINWKFNQKTQDYINNLSGFESGNIGWHANQGDAENYIKEKLDNSDLKDNYVLTVKDNNFSITPKEENKGFAGEAIINWGLKRDVQAVLEAAKINDIGFFENDIKAKGEAITKLDGTDLKGKYKLETNSQNDFKVIPTTSEFSGTGVIKWKRSKNIQKYIIDNGLNDLGWMENEIKAKEAAIQKLDKTDLNGEYNIELDSNNDLVVTPTTSQFIGTGKITWRRATVIQNIINDKGIADIGWADTETEAINIAKEKLDNTVLEGKYDIKNSGTELSVTSKDIEFSGVGKIKWQKSSSIQEFVNNNMNWRPEDQWFPTGPDAYKEAERQLKKSEIKYDFKLELGYDSILRVTSKSGRYSGVGVLGWNKQTSMGDAVRETDLQTFNTYYEVNRNDYGSAGLVKYIDSVLDKTELKNQYEIKIIDPSDLGSNKNVGEARQVSIIAKNSKKYYDQFTYVWNAQFNLRSYINADPYFRNLGTIGEAAPAQDYATKEYKKRLDTIKFLKGKYYTWTSQVDGEYRIYIKIEDKYKYQFFNIDSTYATYTPLGS